MRTVTREFNDTGEKITNQLKYEDLEVSKLPDRCQECPIGFMLHGCGIEFVKVLKICTIVEMMNI